MKRTLLYIALLALLLSSAVPVGAEPLVQGGAVSGSFGDPNDMYLEFSISGGDLKLREGTPSSYEGPWSGGPITFSGRMTVSRPYGVVSYVSMSANLAGQAVEWPAEGESSEVTDRSVSIPFNFSFSVPPDYEGSAVTGSAWVQACGGVCGSYSVDFRLDLPTPAPTDESAPTSMPAAASTPTPCPKLSAAGKLTQILDRYSARIPKGPTTSGKLTNTYDFLGYEGYAEFVCGGYQSKVLAFLDGLKFSADPCEQALLDDWDYGPIQSWWGYHQAVVLYPRGTNWLETGLVLDPWIDQAPKVYNIDEWAIRFSGGSFHGIGGSEVYTTQPQYPTVGGSYTPPGGAGLTKEETAFVQALPPEKQAVFAKMSRHEQKRWLKAAMAGRSPLRKVAAHCPLNLYLISPAGARSGFPGGEPLAELADVVVRRLSLSDGTYWTELEYPENAGYTLVLEGTGSGQAYVLTGDGATVEPQRSPVQQYAFAVEAGRTYQLATDRLGQPLLSGGEMLQPTVLQGSAPDWLGGLPDFADIPEFAPGESASAAPAGRWLLLGGGLAAILLLGGVALVLRRGKGRAEEWEPIQLDLPRVATVPCPYCGAAVEPNARFCSECGRTPEPGGWQVQVVDGPDAGRTFPLGARARLGRSSDSDVHLGDPQASRLHAVVEQLRGDYVLTDQGSRNGTFLNGVRLEGPARLRDGDLIKIGNSLLRVVAPPAPVARPPAPAAYPAPAGAPAGEGVVGVIAYVDRRKGLFGAESFTLVLTPERLIFAKVTNEMLKAAVEQARQAAKAQGKGFFGQWGAQLGAYSAHAQGYFQMPVEAILREHPDNFQIPVAQVHKVQAKHGQYDEQSNNPDQLIIQAGDKLRFNLKGSSAGEAKKVLKQVLGDRVK